MSDIDSFTADMAASGFRTEHYHGRAMWHGPAVRTDETYGPSLQDVIRATIVPVQWDNMGDDYIVYPKESQRGDYFTCDRANEEDSEDE